MDRGTAQALAHDLKTLMRMIGCRRSADSFAMIEQAAGSHFFWNKRKAANWFMSAVEDMFEEWAANQH